MLTRDGARESAGVTKIDSAGRRWYTNQFKREIVVQCLQPGASVAGIAVDNGLNPNLVRKWIERVHKETRTLAPLLPVVLADPRSAAEVPIESMCIEIRIGGALIGIGARASAQQIEAVVRALR